MLDGEEHVGVLQLHEKGSVHDMLEYLGWALKKVMIDRSFMLNQALVHIYDLNV